MGKAARFPRKMEVWVSDAYAQAFELLASDGLLTISDHARQAFRMYLTQMRALPAPQPAKPNGQHQQPEQTRGL
jgi:hypothetical protein